ncbi:hypothetical protein HDV00_008087 [Rhizophlyctis rosea]|nr:hypothetical protein HDV00_008087 [Rhizophlyctis rosea]
MGSSFVIHDCSDEEKVSAISLDHWWKNTLGGRQVNMMKIDIEGHEPKAIRGATEMFRKAPPFVLATEFYPDAIKRQGSNPGEYLGMFRDFGYTIYNLEMQEFGPEQEAKFLEQGGIAEIIAIHKSGILG